MLLLFVCLLEIYLILRKTKTADQPKYFRWLIKIPFSIYIGWITVATVANATDVLSLAGSGNGILGIAPLIWAALMIMVSVIIWAVVGIAVKFPSENWIVCAVTLVVLAFVVAGLYPKLKEG
jgi:hypothetical protein